ncbi:MAG: hypothetical protein LBL60_00470 [Mycoplasmataceae bacterium]|nr:hypothetical protein [Mycoplasmataceae bacterium]
MSNANSANVLAMAGHIISAFFSILIILFLIITIVGLSIYLCVYYRLSKKGYTVKLSKYELLVLLWFLFLSLLTVFVGFLLIGAQTDDTNWGYINMGTYTTLHSIVAFGFPLLDIFIMIPLLVFNSMTFTDHLWEVRKKTYGALLTDGHKDFNLNVLHIIFNMVGITIIFFLLSQPESIIYGIGEMFDNVMNKSKQGITVLQFITVWIVILFLISIFIYDIIFYARSIYQQNKHLIKPWNNRDFLVNAITFFDICAFLITLSVITMWTNSLTSGTANPDGNTEQIATVLGVVNVLLVIPVFVIGTIHNSNKLLTVYGDKFVKRSYGK